MQILLLLRSKKDTGVYEEGLLAIGALANVVEANFNRFMKDLEPYLIQSLSNCQEYSVCNVAVGVVGDIARALGPTMEPYCDKIVTVLLEDLKNKDLDRSVKPSILSAFGDIALAIGQKFEKYVDTILNMLKQASLTVMNTPLNPDDYDTIEYFNLLREGICEAYTAAIQSLSGENSARVEKISPFFPAIFSFIIHVANDPLRSEAVTRGAVGIIGDLASTYKMHVRPFCQQQAVQGLIADCYQNSENKNSKDVAKWAQSVTRF